MREYAASLKDADVDTVILGCTHYPLIRPIFQRVFGRGVTLVFSAEETAREVAETLARKDIENAESREGAYRFLTTGDPGALPYAGTALPPAPDRQAPSTSRSRPCKRSHEERRSPSRRAASARHRAGLPRAAARLRPVRAGQDDRALHGHRRGGCSALVVQERPRLDDGRVRDAARRPPASVRSGRSRAGARTGARSRSSG